ncbi:hypothetical protein J437_LFUL017559 [Ladona fulva]|uniref:Uncharacterized protein n=1 Tax=Ladona fulva TaxID=123851 RepID=A0A8K0P6D1_LADFU|nr:hypothetical protein J437_LFUL017559 [Ladona fulva]
MLFLTGHLCIVKMVESYENCYYHELGEFGTAYEDNSGSDIIKGNESFLEEDDNNSGKIECVQRVPKFSVITWWLFRKNKRNKVPFECHLLQSFGRLPKQMTRGPFLYGQGMFLEKIQEDPLREVSSVDDEVDMNDHHVTKLESTMANKKFSFDLQSKNKKTHMPAGLMKSIPEGTRLEEHIFHCKYHRKKNQSDQKYLDGIPEIERIQEMIEEEQSDEDQVQSGIWT